MWSPLPPPVFRLGSDWWQQRAQLNFLFGITLPLYWISINKIWIIPTGTYLQIPKAPDLRGRRLLGCCEKVLSFVGDPRRELNSGVFGILKLHFLLFKVGDVFGPRRSSKWSNIFGRNNVQDRIFNRKICGQKYCWSLWSPGEAEANLIQWTWWPGYRCKSATFDLVQRLLSRVLSMDMVPHDWLRMED